MAVQLKFVESASAIRKSIETFNAGASTALDLVCDLIRQTSYWVFDPSTQFFAPSKFAAFEELTLQQYEAARNGEGNGEPFDGHATRIRIEKLLGVAYSANAELEGKLITWTRETIPGRDDLLNNVDRSKWKFVSLPLESSA